MAERKTTADQNENHEKKTTDIETKQSDIDTSSCMIKHGFGDVCNMRRFDGQIQFHVKCKVCDRKEWQPAKMLKHNYPQKVIEFYEQCIEWKRPNK